MSFPPQGGPPPRPPYPPSAWGQQPNLTPSSAMLYGYAGDPRCPSPRKLRRVFAFAIDWLIHAGCAAATEVGAQHGLCLIRPADGGRPTVGQLAGAWVRGIWVSIVVAAAITGASTSGDDLDEDKAFLPAVRRRDVRALRRA